MEINLAFSVTFFALCVGLNINLNEAVKAECRVTSPEAAWLDGCNWCSCVETPTGSAAICTLKGCLPNFKSPIDCRGDANWKIDCNWCHCNNEQATCTKKLCRGTGRQLQVEVSQASENAPNPGAPECVGREEGYSFARDCNTCHCTSTGHAVCTQRGCISAGTGKQLQVQITQNAPNNPIRSPECANLPAGGTFQKDCNTCSCSSNGVAVCTEKFCLSGGTGRQLQVEVSQASENAPNPGAPECVGREEGYSFARDCNTCHCTSTGHAVCTQRGCISAGTGKQLQVQITQNAPNNPIRSPECARLPAGGTFQRDCNTCSCSRDGVAVCTLRFCLSGPGNLNIGKQLSHNVPSKSPECEGQAEGYSFKKSCNTCHCTSTGHAVCTQRFCLEAEAAIPPPDALFSTPECEGLSANATFMRDCNTCTCTTTGLAACTQRGCINQGRQLSGGSAERCTGNVTWKKDCNVCRCNNGFATCSRKLCRPGKGKALQDQTSGRSGRVLPADAECEARSKTATWKKDCNTCVCNENTNIATCTRMSCLPENPANIRDDTASECEGDVSWKKGCNWCQCANGKAICQRTACDGEGRSLIDGASVECNVTSPGSRWLYSCNWCSCNENQLAMCTRRACPPALELRSPDGKECEGDAAWKVGCNWCNCVNDKAVCSKKLCPADKVVNEDNSKALYKFSAEEAGCAEGTSWIDGCNTCFCNEGSEFCTLKHCIEDSTLEPTVFKTHSVEINGLVDTFTRSANSECTEGSRWKKACNWCTCSNGKAACTEKGCLLDKEEPAPFCEENSFWKEDCNRCMCHAGIPLCTKMRCLSHVPKPVENAAENEGLNCKEGSRWRKNCNWCSCSNNIGLCTLRGCIGGPLKEPECEGTSEWKNGSEENCTWCVCEEGKAVCKPIPCNSGRVPTPEEPIPNEPTPVVGTGLIDCKHGSRWRDECNWCSCNNNIGICTLKGCIPGGPSSEPECVGTAEWKKYEKADKCSWCVCQEGKAICKSIPSCKAEGRASTGHFLQVVKDESVCAEGSKWRVKCNWCHCSKEGQAICSYVACTSGSEGLNETECEGESRWKRDCNWCNCVSGKSVCEQKACAEKPIPSELSDEKEVCVAGNTWTEECNVCMCVSNVTVCTKKFCAELRSESCIDGNVWKDDCNSCKCRNGQATCTQKSCAVNVATGKLSPVCYLPVITPGAKICGGFETKWTFNPDADSCEQVVYGGCGGSDNLFSTVEDCQTACGQQRRGKEVKPGNSKERCYLSIDEGPCFALIKRYAFVQAKGRCEEFLYGGCRGNQNNFVSAEECYDTCGGNPPAAVPTCDRAQCDWKRFSHYLAKDCNPIYEGGACCPTRFACRSEKDEGKHEDRCYYKNKEYGIGEQVSVDNPCEKRCTCQAPRSSGQTAKIVCAQAECPSLFMEPEPNCREIFSIDSCCSVDKVCQDPSIPPELEQRSTGCEWNGKKWLTGDKMFFDELPCHSCICTNEFTGPNGAGCKKIDCGIDLRYRSQLVQGCTPVFFEERCCPTSWICPNDKKLLKPSEDLVLKGATLRTDSCSIGDISVPIGTLLNVTDCHLKCRCDTPPDITCVQYSSCELAAASLVPPKPEANCPEASCPASCHEEMEPTTGCPNCICSSTDFSCQEPLCPPLCVNGTVVFDESIGCHKCQCECRKGPTGGPPCPADCKIKMTFDEESGCDICICDRPQISNQE